MVHYTGIVHTQQGQSALTVAAGGGHIDAVKMLLNAGADPNIADKVRCVDNVKRAHP